MPQSDVAISLHEQFQDASKHLAGLKDRVSEMDQRLEQDLSHVDGLTARGIQVIRQKFWTI